MSGSRSRHERGYGALLLLYPRAFRRDYGEALIQFFRDDVQARGAARAWGRALADLFVSVPVQHVEVTLMERSPARTVGMLGLPVLAGFAALAFGHFVILTVPLALGASVVMYVSSRRVYNEAVAGVASHWWKVLAAGVAVLLTMGVAATYGPDMDWFPWYLAVLTYLIGWGLIIAGAVLGTVHLWRAARRRPAHGGAPSL